VSIGHDVRISERRRTVAVATIVFMATSSFFTVIFAVIFSISVSTTTMLWHAIDPMTLLASNFHSELPFWTRRVPSVRSGIITEDLSLMRIDIHFLKVQALFHAALVTVFFDVFPDVAGIDIERSVRVVVLLVLVPVVVSFTAFYPSDFC